MEMIDWKDLAEKMSKPYWKCDDKDDSEIPESHFHYEHTKKPVLTAEELHHAQERAVNVYNNLGYVNEKEIYAYLGLNHELAIPTVHFFENRNAVRKHVREVALKYFHVQVDWSGLEVGDEIHIPVESKPVRITPDDDIQFGRDFVEDFDEDFDGEGESEMLHKSKAIVKAKKELNDLLLKKHELTFGDVYNVLGIKDRHTRKERDIPFINIEASTAYKNERIEQELSKIHDSPLYFPDKLPYGFIPVKMWQTDNGYTTVEWNDCTKTTVKTEDGKNATAYGGFCACVVKKLYGSTGQAIKMMEHADKNAKWPAEKKRIEREKLKKIHQANAEMRKEEEAKRREHMIEMHMEEIYAKREAERRVAEADAREEKKQ